MNTINWISGICAEVAKTATSAISFGIIINDMVFTSKDFISLDKSDRMYIIGLVDGLRIARF